MSGINTGNGNATMSVGSGTPVNGILGDVHFNTTSNNLMTWTGGSSGWVNTCRDPMREADESLMQVEDLNYILRMEDYLFARESVINLVNSYIDVAKSYGLLPGQEYLTVQNTEHWVVNGYTSYENLANRTAKLYLYQLVTMDRSIDITPLADAYRKVLMIKSISRG